MSRFTRNDNSNRSADSPLHRFRTAVPFVENPVDRPGANRSLARNNRYSRRSPASQSNSDHPDGPIRIVSHHILPPPVPIPE